MLQGDRTVASLALGTSSAEMGVLERGCATPRWSRPPRCGWFRMTNWDVKRLPKDTRARLADLVQSRQEAGSADGA